GERRFMVELCLAQYNKLEGKSGVLYDAVAQADSSIIGEWKEIKKTIVGAMHLALVRPTKIILIDKAGKNPEAVYPDGRYAYSVEYDLTTGNSRILSLKTNTFCSAG
ncbi:16940_t:CDS:2, partial [Racocetra persica]